MGAGEHDLMKLVVAISVGDMQAASRLLTASPTLATVRAQSDLFIEQIQHYMYRGDSALHVAAAAHQHKIADALIAAGADVRANNRRGAEPLHYAADGIPGSSRWNPGAQAATIITLVHSGADPNAFDRDGVTPLHRAVRTRCAAAVGALLEYGADPRIANRRGSAPADLLARNTGRGGSGSAEAKAQRQEIARLLEAHSRLAGEGGELPL